MLKIPVTASDIAGWIRLAANAVNGLITSLDGLETRAVALEAFQASATADIAALETRATDLETFAALPFTVSSITLTPAALPASPTHGMIVTDIADGKPKFYNGTTWQLLY